MAVRPAEGKMPCRGLERHGECGRCRMQLAAAEVPEVPGVRGVGGVPG